MAEKFIGLTRVSTNSQEQSGLGLEVGLEDILNYVKSVDGILVDSVQEIGSGGKNDLIERPFLQKAIKLCKKHDAVLLIPKIDRLVRSTEVHTDIRRSKIKYRAVDMPNATEFQLDIYVAMAAEERRKISDRTKRALQKYRENKHVPKRLKKLYPDGVPQNLIEETAGKLGARLTGCKLSSEQRSKGGIIAGRILKEESISQYPEETEKIKEWVAQRLTFSEIADKLNQIGTRNGGIPWAKYHISRILKRLNVPQIANL